MKDLCNDCALSIYGYNKPTKEYAEYTADLLFGTGAAESKYMHRRQLGYSIHEQGGAWGLWQMQVNALTDCFTFLRRNDMVATKVEQFIGSKLEGILLIDLDQAIKLVHSWDRFAVAMARIHYFQDPEPIPDTHEGRAAYYVRVYNRGGKANIQKYLRAYEQCL